VKTKLKKDLTGKNKSGAKSAEGAAQAWDAAAAKANGGADKRQARLPLDEDTEQIAKEIELPTPLNDSELAFVSAKVVDTTVRIEELEAEVAEYTKPRRKEISQLNKERTKLTREAHTRARWGLVPCREVHHFRTRAVEVYRLDRGDADVGELVERRAMTAEELERATFAPPAPDGEHVVVE
jgi:hypothetical protein